MASACSAPPTRASGEVGAAAAKGSAVPAWLEAMKPPMTEPGLARSTAAAFWVLVFDQRVLRNRLLELRIGDDDLRASMCVELMANSRNAAATMRLENSSRS